MSQHGVDVPSTDDVVSNGHDVICTRVAVAGWNDHQFMGEFVFAQLAGNESLTGLLALAVLGVRPTPEQRDVLDDLACVMTLADPRIPPLKMARIVASYGGELAGVAAGILACDGARIGPWQCGEAAMLLQRMHGLALDTADDATLLAWIDAERARLGMLAGFGVPFRGRDERMAALRVCLQRRDRVRLPAWTFTERLMHLLERERDLKANIALGAAAACQDIGVPGDTVATLMTALCHHTFMANCHEGAQQRAPSLLRLPEGASRYVGSPPRTSPRASTCRRPADP